jgi:diketogulonate reductase-like aldo/keto reductase
LELQRAGKIRSFGASNFDVDDLEDALRIVSVEQIACNQVLYHLQQRYIEAQLIPWCQARGVTVVAYSPFGSGSFPRAGASGGVLAEIAKAHDASRYQVALAYLLRIKELMVIPKASQVAHVRDNAAALSLQLSDEQIAAIDRAFPLDTSRGLPMI